MNNHSVWRRTHHCGELTASQIGESVTLCGWISRLRDHGGLIFINLRDRWGLTQAVIHPDEAGDIYSMAKRLKMESVIGVRGEVSSRPDDMVNRDMPTGAIEVTVHDLTVFNEAKPLPFLIQDPTEASDELRLTYRYLDLRRPSMQKTLLLRHKTAQIVRRFFDEDRFVEIETPFLMKSTPEGARDYLVPSRVHRGRFYALPQSPQTYKQLLMVAGYDRYFQIVRCFRDEDLRADRQPEFTQIDVEMSFVDEEDIYDVVERLMVRLFRDVLDKDLKRPFPRMTYDEAVGAYGTDRPDLRYDLRIVDVSDLAAACGFRIFRETVEKGGAVRGLCLKQAGSLSRKQVDDLTAKVQSSGAKGLVTIQVKENEIVSPVSKFLTDAEMTAMCDRFGAQIGDAIFIVADSVLVLSEALGILRTHLADVYQLADPNQFALLWVVDFPLLEWSETEGRHLARHHPFTSPRPEHIPLLDSEPGNVYARAYDLVLNGSEIAGGSIRNHRADLQRKIFQILGIDKETAQRKFGFLMDALDLGAPPHGGIAFGFDRLVALLAGESSIREVIAFPKTTSALSLMDGSPSEVAIDQLKELGLCIDSES